MLVPVIGHGSHSLERAVPERAALEQPCAQLRRGTGAKSAHLPRAELREPRARLLQVGLVEELVVRDAVAGGDRQRE